MQESMITRATKSFWERERKQFLTALISVFVIGFIAHGYCFANLTISHDSLNGFSILTDWRWKAALGRFFEPIYDFVVQGVFATPWLVGILSLFWTSISVWLICKMFCIKKIS